MGIMSQTRVLKFGGTSVKNIARMEHVAVIRSRCQRQESDRRGLANGRHHRLFLKLAHQCNDVPDRRELDMLLSTGEQISISLLTMLLKNRKVKACSFTAGQIGIFTEAIYGSADIVRIDREKIEKAFKENDVLVVAGFQGITESGDITTLGRGGSDTTAVALAVASMPTNAKSTPM